MNRDVTEVLAAAVEAVGGSERRGQVEMACTVADAFGDSTHLLVQAGTGTGKSLGYLVPSALHPAPVVVATATLNLQRQIVDRDLPALERALIASGREPVDTVVVKGRSNYACLHRVRSGVPEDQDALIELPTSVTGAQVLKLREWAEDQAEAGGTGDKDDAPAHVDATWRQISVTARECIGAQRCPFAQECFAERARAEAQDADLIITNHAMLAIDAIEGVPMLPEHKTVVIDEAHELVARVTQASTAELDPGIIERAARSARTHVDDPLAAEQLSDAADALADVLTGMEPGTITADTTAVANALALVRDAARSCWSAFPKGEAKDADAGAHRARSRVDEIRQIADRMATFSALDVLWLADGASRLGLRVAPVDVAGTLRDKLFAERSVVLTSATLKLGGRFDAAARAVGLGFGDLEWNSLDVGSPFDYAKQAILYVGKHLPPPGRDGLGAERLSEITSLVRAAGGRTLGLFSSRRAAEEAAAYVREQIPELPVLCQGDAQLGELVRQFQNEPEATLFGTLSLWQGVDVPGATCTLVLIDRIPFPRPDDPVMNARQRLIEKRGGNGFMEVAAQHAALLLAQGTGRLIRGTGDRGVVAVLDPRLITARYGAYLVNSLPPMHRTTNLDGVLESLRRLDTDEKSKAEH